MPIVKIWLSFVQRYETKSFMCVGVFKAASAVGGGVEESLWRSLWSQQHIHKTRGSPVLHYLFCYGCSFSISSPFGQNYNNFFNLISLILF